MSKRGQVTIFIILGIIIIVAIVFGISMRKQIAKAVTGTETSEALSFTEQSQLVKEHVEDCLKESLKESVTLPEITSRTLVEETYKRELAVLVEGRADACVDFRKFTNLLIEREDKLNVEIAINTKKTEISAIARCKVSIDSGTDSTTLSEFESSLKTVV